MKFVAVLLTIIFVMPTWVFADIGQGEVLEQNDISSADIFDVHVTPRATHDGYMFRLVQDAVFSYADFVANENVQVIFAPKRMFRANALQDIKDFVAPELIMYIEPDYIVFLDDIPAYEHVPLTFVPHAFAEPNDPFYRYQWCLGDKGTVLSSHAPWPLNYLLYARCQEYRLLIEPPLCQPFGSHFMWKHST